jgi:hypothetical protein
MKSSSFPRFDRFALKIKPLSSRQNKKQIERDFILPDFPAGTQDEQNASLLDECVGKIIEAKANQRPVMLAFGAHTIKNGLALVLIKLIEDGWITHLATNGAGIIHDWEFAFQGMTGEDVKAYVRAGQFGIWQETGFFINLAINIGAYEGKGYGEAVGAMIQNEKLIIPAIADLEREAARELHDHPEQSAAAAEMMAVARNFDLKPGEMAIPHKWKDHSIQAAAYRLRVPFTSHPMIGHDIIYCHPMNNGTLLGRAAMRDFLSYAESVSRIENGVYLSIGSAVMSPMIFEKSFSMAQNMALQRGSRIENHHIFVADLASSHWDWSRGEPPEDNPDYYLRYNKTFSRMGGSHRYLSIDNRDFLLSLYGKLKEKKIAE